jgi:hypothetical protein
VDEVAGEPLVLKAEDAVVLGRVSDLYALLAAIDAVMPDDAIVYLEGTSIAPDVAEFLESRQPIDPPAIRPNTLWPAPRGFHLPLTGTNLAELRSIAAQHAEPEVTDHVVVYRGRGALLWAHDAGDGYVSLAKSLPSATVERFRNVVGSALRP